MGKKKIKPQPSSESTDEDQIPPSQQHHQEHEEDEDQASSSDTESDSGSEADPPPPSPPKSKPTDQTPKSDSKPHPSKKRPTNNSEPMNDSKRGKNKKTDVAVSAVADENEDAETKKSGGDSKKKLFQRLWSEDDEIAILKGMLKFTSEIGSDPYKHADAFYDFMKELLHVEASSFQLKEKIRRMKKKFETNAQKTASLSKPHDLRAFELSKKVWGNAAGGGGGVDNEEPVKNNEGRAMKVAPPKPKPELQNELSSVDAKKDVKMKVDEKTDKTSRLMELMRLDRGFGLYGLNEDVVKRGMELIGASERAELEEEWKELQHAELDLHVKRAELIANQARMILEAYNSSNH